MLRNYFEERAEFNIKKNIFSCKSHILSTGSIKLSKQMNKK